MSHSGYLVTPGVSLKFENNVIRNYMSHWHCDWLTIAQQHDPALPDYVGGRVLKVSGLSSVRFGDAGVAVLGDSLDVDYCTGTFDSVRGSFDTSLEVRCIGGRVEVSGNPSHWGRLDAVFGLDLDACVAVCNAVLELLGLPAFTPWRSTGFSVSRDGVMTHGVGAELVRVDVTTNLMTGLGRVRDFQRWAAGQKLYRSAPSNPEAYGFETVYLSKSGSWLGAKVYDKSLSLERQAGAELVKRTARAVKAGRMSDDAARLLLTDGAGYLNDLAEWAASVGLCRYELRFGRKLLADRGWRGWVPGSVWSALCVAAGAELDRLTERAVMVTGDVEDLLTPSELSAYRRWLRGVPSDLLCASRATYYRVRASIMKKTGADIARPASVAAPVQARPVFFRVAPASLASAPAFYRPPALMAA